MKTPSVLEPLELRIAPAAVFTYVDVDGDKVVVTTSKGTNAQLAAAVTVTANQLTLLDLGSNAAFAGTSISIIATRDPVAGGDGLANVGRIDATGADGGTSLDLGAVFVDGDLDAIDAGDAVTTTAAIKSLTVLSMGAFIAAGDDTTSTINGALGKFVAKSDVKEVFISVIGGDDGRVGSVTIGGSLIGGGLANGGAISSNGDMGPVKIGQDLRGGFDTNCGLIATSGKLASVSIGGSIIGGFAINCGRITASEGLGLVKIAHDIRGGAGNNSGTLATDGKLAGASIGGSVIGGAGTSSGAILCDFGIGLVKIAHDLRGGSAGGSGSIGSTGTLAGVSVGGSLIGGSAANAGAIFTIGGDVGPVKIGRDLLGGSSGSAGIIITGGKLAGLTIGGSLVGGSASNTGLVAASTTIGPVVIGGSLIGGSFKDMSAVTSGVVRAGGALASIRIGGDLRGGSNSATMPLDFYTVDESGYIQAQRIGSVFIAGSIISGSSNQFTPGLRYSGSIRVHDDLGAVKIAGSLIGNSTAPVVISARGQASPTASADVAIKSLTVLGRVNQADILAGNAVDGSPRNADAQIGKVIVGGDWTSSDLAAGTFAFGFTFGDGNDVKISGGGTTDLPGIVSKIASIQINGHVIGTSGAGDSYGFIAQQIGSFKLGNTSFALTPGAGNDLFAVADTRQIVGTTGDVRVHEIAL